MRITFAVDGVYVHRIKFVTETQANRETGRSTGVQTVPGWSEATRRATSSTGFMIPVEVSQ